MENNSISILLQLSRINLEELKSLLLPDARAQVPWEGLGQGEPHQDFRPWAGPPPREPAPPALTALSSPTAAPQSARWL